MITLTVAPNRTVSDATGNHGPGTACTVSDARRGHADRRRLRIIARRQPRPHRRHWRGDHGSRQCRLWGRVELMPSYPDDTVTLQVGGQNFTTKLTLFINVH